MSRQRPHSYTKWAGYSDAVTEIHARAHTHIHTPTHAHTQAHTYAQRARMKKEEEEEEGKQGWREKQEQKVKTCQDVGVRRTKAEQKPKQKQHKSD